MDETTTFIQQKFEQHTHHQFHDEIEHIFVINENNGTCDACVVAYSEYLATLPALPKAAFIVNKMPLTQADSILRQKQTNVYKGDNIPKNLLDPLSDLAYVKLSKGRVDTIIVLHYPANEQLKTIDSLLRSH